MSRQQQTGDSTSRVSHGTRTGLSGKAPIKVTKMIKEPAARTKVYNLRVDHLLHIRIMFY